MDIILENEDEFDKIILSKKQMEFRLHRTFINGKHWDLFKTNFLYHFIYMPKKDIFAYYEFILKEYEDTRSREEKKKGY